jgi:hypothetical protein
MKSLFPKLFVIIFAWANTPIINWGYLFLHKYCFCFCENTGKTKKTKRCEKQKGIFLEKMNPRPYITRKKIICPNNSAYYNWYPTFLYFPLWPLAKFGQVLLCMITSPPTSQICKRQTENTMHKREYHCEYFRPSPTHNIP